MKQGAEAEEKELIPVDRVLDDMNQDGYAQSIARDYYYNHTTLLLKSSRRCVNKISYATKRVRSSGLHT